LYIGIDIGYDIGYHFEDAPKRPSLPPSISKVFDFDIEETLSIDKYDIQLRPSLYTRYRYCIEVFIRYRVRYRIALIIAISGYKDIEGKNFDVVHDIGAISGYKDIEVFSSISKILPI
jgi:hypothetical protein